MSNSESKQKNSRRRQQDENAIARQLKIAKQAGLGFQHPSVREPHRHAKHHAMNCGTPSCMLCSNPRKLFKELTTQEKRLFQDLDNTRDRHSNGNKTPD